MARALNSVSRVRAFYHPRANFMPSYMMLEYLNGKYFGEIVGREATKMRKELEMKCRVWTMIDLSVWRAE